MLVTPQPCAGGGAAPGLRLEGRDAGAAGGAVLGLINALAPGAGCPHVPLTRWTLGMFCSGQRRLLAATAWWCGFASKLLSASGPLIVSVVTVADRVVATGDGSSGIARPRDRPLRQRVMM